MSKYLAEIFILESAKIPGKTDQKCFSVVCLQYILHIRKAQVINLSFIVIVKIYA